MKKSAILLALLCFIVIIMNGCVSAAEIQSNNKTNLKVANDNGVKYNDNGDNTYGYFYGSSGGLNSIKITNDSSNTNQKVINTSSLSGTFYIMNTGGKGYSDDGILMLAVNGTIPDNFKIHIQVSGYQWTPTTDGSAPNFSNIGYNSLTLDEIFDQTDFIYGPQTWKPYYSKNYPIYEGQDLNNLTNSFNIMFIDLNAGILNPSNSKYSGQTLTDKGMIKIQYSFQNLPNTSLAAFDAFAYSKVPGKDSQNVNIPPGIEWTNSVTALGGTPNGASGYYVGIPKASATPNGGLYNTDKTVTLTMNQDGTIYYTTDGTDPENSPTRNEYTNPITITQTTTLRFVALNKGAVYSDLYSQTYTIDKTAPTVTADTESGLYNTDKTVTLTTTDSESKIYYTTDGTDPENSPTRNEYTNPITITQTTTLKYGAVDPAGNWNKYTQTYTIDKTKPGIIKTIPSYNSIITTLNKITITFNESIKIGNNWIELKNSNGIIIPTINTIEGNILTITPKTLLLAAAKYTVLIHTGSIKDLAGNNVNLYTTNFTLDNIKPKITSSYPIKNATSIPTNPVIKIIFSESIKIGNNWIELKNSSGKIIPTIKTIKGNTLTITPKTLLTKRTKYTVLIHTGSIKDIAGNNVNLYTTNFTTKN